MGTLPGSSEGTCQELVGGGRSRGASSEGSGRGDGKRDQSKCCSPIPSLSPTPWTQRTLITGKCEAKGDSEGKWLFKWYL